jgi:inorganic triphosphatase YgiF
MNDIREIEAKFDADGEDLRWLVSFDRLGDFHVVSRSRRLQEDVYFDTPDEQLAEARSSLRIRLMPHEALLTYKGARDPRAHAGDVTIASRLEDEIPLEVVAARRYIEQPDDLLRSGLSPVERARAAVALHELTSTARLRNERLAVLLESEDGQRIELAADDVVGTRLRDGRETRFSEIELETKGANTESLLAAARNLQITLPGLRQNTRTKLERTLQ